MSIAFAIFIWASFGFWIPTYLSVPAYFATATRTEKWTTFREIGSFERNSAKFCNFLTYL